MDGGPSKVSGVLRGVLAPKTFKFTDFIASFRALNRQ
jgi:hypothetical protein